jgi:hypothetical protein
MTVHYVRPVSGSAYMARRLASFSFLMFIAAWALHRFGPLNTPYFLAIIGAGALVAILAVYLACLGLVMLWSRGARGGKAATFALFLAVLPVVPPTMGLISYFSLPAIHDVSSDLVDPPQWIHDPEFDQSWLGKHSPVTAKDREAQMIAYPGITGRRYDGALDRVYSAVRKVALSQGIAINGEKGAPELAFEDHPNATTSNDNGDAVPDNLDNVPVPVPRPDRADTETPPESTEAVIQGVHRTLVFGFRQDVVIRMREEAETTLVDIRVSSRYGNHDLGSGVGFIAQYLRALDADLLGIAGG